MKAFFKIVFLLNLGCCLGQTNLLDPTEWTSGSGDIPGYTDMRPGESLRESGTDPFGLPSILWGCTSNPAGYLEGGFEALATETLNTAYPYRISVWAKRTGPLNGETRVAFKCLDTNGQETTIRLDGSTNSARNIYNGNPPPNKWVLVVGYIYPSDYNGELNLSGVYDPTNGEKIDSAGEFEFTVANPSLTLRSFLIESAGNDEKLYFFNPHVYQVNGQEPSIYELMHLPDPSNGNAGLWSANANGIHYSLGNVGIATSAPDAPLTVAGQIHASEVKVDTNIPPPDYVFYEDYNLKTLEEVQEYIKEHGHLPNIPSAKEMETNGIELGLMNMKLLEKIEELALYILELKIENMENNVAIKNLQEQINQLRNVNQKIKS